MKTRVNVLLSCLAFASLHLPAPDAAATFIPENFVVARERLPSGPANITEKEFRSIIANLQSAYAPLASAQGARLTISGDWKNEKLNAGAMQIFGNWQVQISGGLARRPELTADGFALILCHELGHHFGGFAFAPADTPFSGVWAAAEGQSDYFSTQVCARKIWKSDIVVNESFRRSATPLIREICDQVWQGIDEQNLCYRTLSATESMTLTMATLMSKPVPQFNTPDLATVPDTKSAHPAVQCRMDTALQGSLCTAVFNEALIPGKKAAGGPFGVEAEREAAASSCMSSSAYRVGLRPSCWFKARL